MDPTTLIGFFAGVGLILSAILLKDASLGIFWDSSSFMLVAGGTLAATLINYSLKDVLGIFSAVQSAFFYKGQEGYSALIKQLLDFAKIWKAEGAIKAQNQLSTVKNPVLRSFLAIALEGMSPKKLEDRLNLELYSMQKHRSLSQDVLFYMGTYAPAFGMIGTVVGLIIMMKQDDTPAEAAVDSLAPAEAASGFDQLMDGMGLALITTLYGVILANLIFFPLSGKLRRMTDEQTLSYEIIREGVISIHAGDPILEISDKCATLIPGSIRQKVLAELKG